MCIIQDITASGAMMKDIKGQTLALYWIYEGIIGLPLDKRGYSEPCSGFKRACWTFMQDIRWHLEPYIGYKRTFLGFKTDMRASWALYPIYESHPEP